MLIANKSFTARCYVTALFFACVFSSCATREGRIVSAPIVGAVAGTVVGVGVGALTGDIGAGAAVGYYTGAVGGIGYSSSMTDRMPANPGYVYQAAPKELRDAGKAYQRINSQLQVLASEIQAAKSTKNQQGYLMAKAKASQCESEAAMWLNRMYQVEWVMNQSVEGKMMGSATSWQADHGRRGQARNYISAFRDLKKRAAKIAR